MIEIPVIDDLNDEESAIPSFPMDFVVAQSHLDALHSKIWRMGDNKMIGGSEEAEMAYLLHRANRISDETGLQSPTRSLQSGEELISDDSDSKERLLGGAEQPNLSALMLPPRTGRGGR